MMEKYKILIVEDDVDLREGLSFSFSGDGYDVTETGTKKDGLQEIANGGYDIVFFWIVTCRTERALNSVKKFVATAISQSLC